MDSPSPWALGADDGLWGMEESTLALWLDYERLGRRIATASSDSLAQILRIVAQREIEVDAMLAESAEPDSSAWRGAQHERLQIAVLWTRARVRMDAQRPKD